MRKSTLLQQEYQTPVCELFHLQTEQCLCGSTTDTDAFGSTLEGWDIETI